MVMLLILKHSKVKNNTTPAYTDDAVFTRELVKRIRRG
jgi:hypothetical protein